MPGDSHIEYASPWAGANYLPFSKPNTLARQYERETWPALAKLASETPDAGIHFQGKVSVRSNRFCISCLLWADTVTYRRAKDQGTPTGEWMADLVSESPWFKELLPNVRLSTKQSIE